MTHHTHENILTQIYEGMTVYDHQGTRLGKVDNVYLGAVNPAAESQGLGPATVSSPEPSDSSLIEDFARALTAPESLPEPLRQRLLRHGFIKIDSAGLFTSDRYATPDQIAHVADDQVTLKVTREELIKG